MSCRRERRDSFGLMAGVVKVSAAIQSIDRNRGPIAARLLTILALVVLVGCLRGPRTRPMTLSSGRTIRVISTGTVTFTDKSPPGLFFKYQTDVRIEQTDELKKIAAEIWTDFQKQAEEEARKSTVSGVAIIANEVPTGWPINHNWAYTLVYKRTEAGTWQLLPSPKK